MHHPLSSVLLFASLSYTILALAPAPTFAHNISLLNDQPSTNFTNRLDLPNRQYHCFSSAVTFPVSPPDCFGAVSLMLTTQGATMYTTFGTAGRYQGPWSWIYGSCAITLSAATVDSARTVLMLLAQAAAEITKTCNGVERLAYTGGSCTWLRGDLVGIYVTVMRWPFAAQ